MNYGMDEHNPPHIHGVYNSKRCSIGLDGTIYEDGNMPKKVLRQLVNFVLENQNILNNMWNNQHFYKIK